MRDDQVRRTGRGRTRVVRATIARGMPSFFARVSATCVEGHIADRVSLQPNPALIGVRPSIGAFRKRCAHSVTRRSTGFSSLVGVGRSVSPPSFF